MAITELTPNADDQSTYYVACAFKDETGAAVTPTSATYSVYDLKGNLINNRNDVSMSPAASTENIILQPADLKHSEGDTRLILVKYTYTNSDGSQTAKQQFKLPINDFVGVA